MKLFTYTKDKNRTTYTLGKLGKLSLVTLELDNKEVSLVLGRYQNWAVLALDAYFREPIWYLQLELTSSPEGWLQLGLSLPGMYIDLGFCLIWCNHSNFHSSSS